MRVLQNRITRYVLSMWSSRPEPVRFDGVVVLITGGGRGLGRAYAVELARRGARVVVNDLGIGPDGTGNEDASPAEAVVDDIRRAGGTAVADARDISNRDGAQGAVASAVDTWGRLDAVVHNAGFVRRAPIDRMPEDSLEDVIDVGLMGAFHLAGAAWPHLTSSGRGRIVLTASGAGLFGAAESSNYAAAKMGSIGLALSLAQEGAPRGINTNVIVPIAQTRLASVLPSDVIEQLGPEQVAPVVAWLCHPECRVNGEIFSAAGGAINRIALAVTSGVRLAQVSVEHVRDSLGEVRSLDDARVVGSSAEALALRLPPRGA